MGLMSDSNNRRTFSASINLFSKTVYLVLFIDIPDFSQILFQQVSTCLVWWDMSGGRVNTQQTAFFPGVQSNGGASFLVHTHITHRGYSHAPSVYPALGGDGNTSKLLVVVKSTQCQHGQSIRPIFYSSIYQLSAIDRQCKRLAYERTGAVLCGICGASLTL